MRLTRQIGQIATNSDREMQFEKKLDRIAEAWRVTRSEVVQHNLPAVHTADRGHVIRGVEQTEEKLADDVHTLQAMQPSRFHRLHREKEKGAIWEETLGCLSVVTQQRMWIQRQKERLRLEHISIGSGDPRVPLAEQAADFDAMDTDSRRILADASRQPDVLEACTAPGHGGELI